jgi:cell division protein FtsX
MFKSFKNISRLNRAWKVLLDEKYLKEFENNLGNTLIKIEEDPLSGNHLIVSTDNPKIKEILIANKSEILYDLNQGIDAHLTDIIIA